MTIRNVVMWLVCLVSLISCKKNTEIDPNLPPMPFTVTAKLVTNSTDIVLTWTKAKDPNSDPVTYAIFYKDTLVQHLSDTTYILKNVGYNTSVVGKVIAFDNHKAATSTSFSITTGDKPFLRFRLKKIESTSSSIIYNYDSLNRLSSINGSNFGLVVCVYDDAQKKLLEFRQYPRSTDLTTGTALQYPYNFPQILNEQNFTAITRPIKNAEVDNSYAATIGGKGYTYSNDRTYLYVSTFYGPPPGNTSGQQHYSYKFSGPNIKKVGVNVPNNYADSTFYDYDDKTNPLFGSVSPTTSDVVRFSRNNITKITSFYYPNFSTPSNVMDFTYEYNKEGLPVKRTVSQNGKEISVETFTYESY